MALVAGPGYHTSSWAKYWPLLFNASRHGNSRFSPLTTGGTVVPTVYGARSQTAALLEAVFHDVHGSVGSRLITHGDRAGRNLVDFELPDRLVLWDLRDDALVQLGLRRDQLVSTTRAHYPCTREWAEALHARKGPGGTRPVGLLWNSRVAELARGDSLLLADLLPGRPEEVFVLFGDQLPTTDPAYYAAERRYDDLSSTAALPLVAAIAEQLGATLV
ncbi:MAG TPA: RES family NAD+ phosphorylase [Acidimicrobiales bacterium]|nr:RES family NAD+ phosphorylase [Acidimicrobiales bacterium]